MAAALDRENCKQLYKRLGPLARAEGFSLHRRAMGGASRVLLRTSGGQSEILTLRCSGGEWSLQVGVKFPEVARQQDEFAGVEGKLYEEQVHLAFASIALRQGVGPFPMSSRERLPSLYRETVLPWLERVGDRAWALQRMLEGLKSYDDTPAFMGYGQYLPPLFLSRDLGELEISERLSEQILCQLTKKVSARDVEFWRQEAELFLAWAQSSGFDGPKLSGLRAQLARSRH